MSKKIYDINFYDLHDKNNNTWYMVNYQLCRTLAMFRCNNLPESIPFRSLELYFQTKGFVLTTKHEYKGSEKPCLYWGGLGGMPDYLYRQSLATIANPAQNFDVQLPIAWEIDDETPENAAVIGLNDPLMLGLLPIHQKYASQLSENELTLYLTDILCRMPWLLSAQDDKTQKSAENFLKNIIEGKFGVVIDSAFLDGIKEHILGNNQHQSLGALIQLHQYYKSGWYQEIGLNSLLNSTKKEAISESEENSNDDILTPFIDIMLSCRNEFCDNFNKFFGDKLGIIDDPISYELNSAWEDNNIEQTAMLDAMLNGEEDEELSENEIQEEETNESSDDNNETEENEENIEEEPENTDEQTIEETIENIDEKVDEILDEITEEEPKIKEEESENNDEDITDKNQKIKMFRKMVEEFLDEIIEEPESEDEKDE